MNPSKYPESVRICIFNLDFDAPYFIEPGTLAGGLIFWTLAFVGCWQLWKRKDSPSWLFVSFLAASEAAAQIMERGSAHYSIQLLPGAAIAAGFGLPHPLHFWRTRGSAATVLLARQRQLC